MKSCLGMLLILAASVVLVAGGALLWYLSATTEFSRKDAGKPVAPAGKVR